MLRHLLKTGDLTRRSERNAVLTRTLFEAFKDRHKEYTNLRVYSQLSLVCANLHHPRWLFFSAFFTLSLKSTLCFTALTSSQSFNL